MWVIKGYVFLLVSDFVEVYDVWYELEFVV